MVLEFLNVKVDVKKSFYDLRKNDFMFRNLCLFNLLFIFKSKMKIFLNVVKILIEFFFKGENSCKIFFGKIKRKD